MTGKSFASFVAVGDSFTEGLDDPGSDGTFRGWADLVAEELAADRPDFRYANLAVRGRLLEPIIAEQVPRAVAMRPDLVSIAGGGNDVLRPRVTLAELRDRLAAGVDELSRVSTVLVFTGVVLAGKLPAGTAIARRAEAYNEEIRRVAAEHGAVLADLAADSAFANARYFSADRLHLGSAGHRRVAAIALRALGIGPGESENVDGWLADPLTVEQSRWSTARLADLRWAREHLVPWIGRRITGRSSGDTVEAKRPELTPLR